MDISRLMPDAMVRLPRPGIGRGQGAPGSGQGPDEKTATKAPAGGKPLTDDQQKLVSKLKDTDAKVRQHEQAHQAAGGSHAGAASYTYQEGPDGKRYAVGGEVPIDTGSERTPEATVRKMEAVKRAALAPGDPSPQDLRVAAQAEAQKLRAQQELNAQAVDGGAGPPHALMARGMAAYGAAARLNPAATRSNAVVA